MLWLLLIKDAQRILRNPWPLVLNLALPLAITALFGLAFGGGGTRGPQVARIKVAIVDEDGSILGSLFKSALSQGDAARHFEIMSPDRDEAVRLLRENKISAAVVVPRDFTKDYLHGESGLEIQVIKNPAQSFYPAIVEELCAVAATGLSALSRNFQGEMPRIEGMITNQFDFLELAGVFTRLGERVNAARSFLTPPLLTYRRETLSAAKQNEPERRGGVFAFILPGMASAFLLFLADHTLRDIHREKRMKTLDRIRSVTSGLRAFILGKVLLAALTVLAGSIILFFGGGLVFGIDWRRPSLIALLCAGYSLFAAGFLAALVALAPSERRSETTNTITLFLLAFAGGSYFPANQLPVFMREHISTLTPNYWFIEALRGAQAGAPDYLAAALVVGKLAAAGLLLAALAGAVLERRLLRGERG